MRGIFLRVSVFVFVTILIAGCGGETNRYVPQVKKSELKNVEVHIKRYGKALFELDTVSFKTGLETIKPEFLLFLDADLNDTANVNQLKAFVSDTLNRFLFNKTMKVFPDLNLLEEEISSALSYYQYYFPEMTTPSFYSYISGGLFEMPVMAVDDVMLIGLDNYLGRDFMHYARLGIPRYKMRWMVKEEVPVDVMRSLYQTLSLGQKKPRILLDMMIASGKQLFFLDAVMPDVADSLKIKYSQKQLRWVKENEKSIWGFLISQKLLFSADFIQTNKLMQDGPFTKGFEGDAPARIGEWVGWQIVSNYMKKNPDVTLKELLKTNDAQMILNKSGYKP
jgi:hypothetical protein